MAFQIKDFASISASLVNLVRSATKKVSDFNIGSVIRTMLDAIAAELEELYLQMIIGLREAIPVSVYNSFSFALIQANAATGLIRVTITASASATLIPSGTVFSAVGTPVTYSSTQDVTIAAGNTFGDVPVAASVVGAVGNIAANASFSAGPSPTGFVSATNLVAFINGQEQETENERKVRFNAFIAALSRATLAALDYGLRTTVLFDAKGNQTERVVSTSIVEPWVLDNTQPMALVNCYIHNGVGGTSGALVIQAQKVVDGYYDASGTAVPGWKAAGVHAVVYAATELSLDLAADLTAQAGYDKPTLVTAAISAAAAYITGLGIGVTFQIASLIDAVMNIPGVANFVPHDFAAPAAAPTLGSNAGGALGATTYYVVITYVTSSGETLASAETSLAVAASRVLTVASPPSKPGIIGWNVYVGTAAGVHAKQNAAAIAIGAGYTEPTSGLVAGVDKPAASTARMKDIAITTSQKLMPGNLAIA